MTYQLSRVAGSLHRGTGQASNRSAPAREVGIVIGVLMGVFILKEPFGKARIIGSGVIVAGLVLIALSP